MNYDSNRPPMAVILAAGIGSRLDPPTDKRAACLMSVGGSGILERTIRNCLSCGISQFVLVLGHRPDEVKRFVDKTFRGIRVTYVLNDRYGVTASGYGLMLAAPAVGTAEFIILDADLVFEPKILRALVDCPFPNVLCVDRNTPRDEQQIKVVTDDTLRVTQIGRSVDPGPALGTAIGLDKISAVSGRLLFAQLRDMMEGAVRAQAYAQAAYAHLVAKALPFHALDITGMKWSAVDSSADLAAANAMFAKPVTTVSRGQQRVLDDAGPQPQRMR